MSETKNPYERLALTALETVVAVGTERNALRAEVERLTLERRGIHDSLGLVTEDERNSAGWWGRATARTTAKLRDMERERNEARASLAQTQRDLQEAAQECKRLRAENEEIRKEYRVQAELDMHENERLADLESKLRGMVDRLTKQRDHYKLKAAPPAVLLVDAEAAAEWWCGPTHSDPEQAMRAEALARCIRAHTRAVDREALAKAMYEAHSTRLAMPSWDTNFEQNREEWRTAADACIAHLSLPSPGEIDREAVDVDLVAQAIDDALCAWGKSPIRVMNSTEISAHAAHAEIARQRRAPRAGDFMPHNAEHRWDRLAGPAGTNTNTGEPGSTREGEPVVDTRRGLTAATGSSASLPPHRGFDPRTNTGEDGPDRAEGSDREGDRSLARPQAASPASPAPRKGGECEHEWTTPPMPKDLGCEFSLTGYKARCAKCPETKWVTVAPPSVQALDAGGEKWTEEQMEAARQIGDRVLVGFNMGMTAASAGLCAFIVERAPRFVTPQGALICGARHEHGPDCYDDESEYDARLADAEDRAANERAKANEAFRQRDEWIERYAKQNEQLDVNAANRAPPPLSPPTGPSDFPFGLHGDRAVELWDAINRYAAAKPYSIQRQEAVVQVSGILETAFASHRSPAAAVVMPCPMDVAGLDVVRDEDRWGEGYNQALKDCERALRAAGVPLAEEKP